MKAVVITASNRAAAGVYADRSGPLIVEWLSARGFRWCACGCRTATRFSRR